MKTVLHSISYAGLWRNQKQLGLEDFLCKSASLGYDGAEITCKRPHAGLLDMPNERRKSIRELLREKKLACAAMAAYTDFCAGLGGGLIPIGEMQLYYIEGVLRLADEWDCRLVRVFTGYEKPEVPYWAQWDACVRGIRECCRMAAPLGITIGIQNHHDIALDAGTLRDFLGEVGCENCKAMYDPWSPCAQGLSLREELPKIAEQVVYTTLADYRLMPRQNYRPQLVNYERQTPLLRAVAIGDGFIGNEEYLTLLSSYGYDGFVAYEMCSDLEGGGSEENLDRCAKRFLSFMEKYR